jgi:tellurite methyltransferase
MVDVDNAVPAGVSRWDQKFAENPDQWFFGREPSELARLTLQYWRQIHGERIATVLDLGCGEGRDTVYFSKHGFRVTAVDGSEAALTKLRRLADEQNVTVSNIVQADIREYPSSSQYDIVCAHNCLQFVGTDCLPTLARLRANTAVGGLNSISAFTRETQQLEGRADLYRFDSNELKFEYRGWRSLLYGEETLWREPSKMYLSFAKTIAQKPVQSDR